MFFHIITCFHFCWFWNIFFDTLQLVSGYFCAILVRNLIRVVVSCNVSMKTYPNSTEIEAIHLKIYSIQKTSGNLKKTSSRYFWRVMWRHVMWTFRTIFVGNFTMHLYHSMDRCTLQEFWIQEFLLFIIFNVNFKTYQISNFFAMDCMY